VFLAKGDRYVGTANDVLRAGESLGVDVESRDMHLGTRRASLAHAPGYTVAPTIVRERIGIEGAAAGQHRLLRLGGAGEVYPICRPLCRVTFWPCTVNQGGDTRTVRPEADSVTTNQRILVMLDERASG
jgi:hypothetical protein